MKKIFAIIKMSWQRSFVYRSTVYGYRLSNIFEILMQFAIWTAVFKNTQVVNGYNYNEMITYLISWLFLFITLNYGIEFTVARDIQQGTLSNYLLKPVDYINI